MVASIEQHVEFIADCIDYVKARGLSRIEATSEAQEAWVDHVNMIAERDRLSARATRGTSARTCPASRACSCPCSASRRTSNDATPLRPTVTRALRWREREEAYGMSGPVNDVDTDVEDSIASVAVTTKVEVIASRTADVGGETVHRALPRRARRTIGAWCFLDHFGPHNITPTTTMQVGPHPHLGLHTRDVATARVRSCTRTASVRNS